MASLLDRLAAVAGLPVPAPPSPPPPAPAAAATRDARKPADTSPARARTASVPSSWPPPSTTGRRSRRPSAHFPLRSRSPPAWAVRTSNTRPSSTRCPALRSVLRRAIDAAVHPATAIAVSAAAAFRTDAPPTLLGAATFALVAACLVLVMDVPWRLYRAAAAAAAVKPSAPSDPAAAASSRAPSPAADHSAAASAGIAFHATVSVSGHDRIVRRALLASAVAAPVVASVLLAVLQARLHTWLLDEIDPLLVAVTGSVRALAHVAAIAARRRRLRRRVAAAAPGDAAAHQLLSAARQAVDAVHHAAAAVLAAAGGGGGDGAVPPVTWSPRRRLRTRTASVSSTHTLPRHRARRASAPVPSASPSPPRRRSSRGPRHALWSVDRAPWAVWLFLAWLRAVVAAWTVPVAVVAWVLGWTWWWVQIGAAVVKRAVDVCTASTAAESGGEGEKMRHGARGRRRTGPPEWDSTTSGSSAEDERPMRRAFSRRRHRSKSIRPRTSPSRSPMDPTAAARARWTSRAVAAVLASRVRAAWHAATAPHVDADLPATGRVRRAATPALACQHARGAVRRASRIATPSPVPAPERPPAGRWAWGWGGAPTGAAATA